MRTINQHYKVAVGNGGLVYSVTECRGEGNYSFGIEMRCNLFGDENQIKIDDISTDFGFVKRLVDLLADNLVTPCTAKDVVEDYLVAQSEV